LNRRTLLRDGLAALLPWLAFARDPLAGTVPAAAEALLVWLLARLWVEWQWFGQFDLTGPLARRWALQLLGAGVGLALCWAMEA
jgi:hypothetical protein